jgi:hypothetical protein
MGIEAGSPATGANLGVAKNKLESASWQLRSQVLGWLCQQNSSNGLTKYFVFIGFEPRFSWLDSGNAPLRLQALRDLSPRFFNARGEVCFPVSMDLAMKTSISTHFFAITLKKSVGSA